MRRVSKIEEPVKGSSCPAERRCSFASRTWKGIMKRTALVTFLMTMLPFAGLAGATDAVMPKGVVELFTSQGCSSCPKADAAFEKLAHDSSVIALSYHVDYWNYLGWKDTLSTPENTRRQYDYAAGLKRSNVYTPQAVVNGRMHLNGGDLRAIEQQIVSLATEKQALDIPISVTLDDDCIRIGVAPGKGDAHVVIAYFTPRLDVRIEKGENAGKTISYHNVVSSLETIGMWEGDELKIQLPVDMLGKPGKERAAILLQTEGSDGALGPIRGGALVPVPAS